MPVATIYIPHLSPDGSAEHALFTDLFRRHGAKIFFYFLKYVKRHEVAEDLLQDLFANIWSKRGNLLKEKNTEAYLFVSARNLLYNHLKQIVEEALPPLQEDVLSFSSEHVEETIRYRETAASYYEALVSLSPQRRRAFVLSREQGLSYQEIAQQMGISPRTVEKHISEALQLLKGKLTVPYTLCFLFIIW